MLTLTDRCVWPDECECEQCQRDWSDTEQENIVENEAPKRTPFEQFQRAKQAFDQSSKEINPRLNGPRVVVDTRFFNNFEVFGGGSVPVVVTGDQALIIMTDLARLFGYTLTKE